MEKKFLSGTLIHTADLYSATKPPLIAREWSGKINQEFTNQVNEEKSLGLPITPYMQNLDKIDVMAKQEIGFINFIIQPLWKKVNEFFENALSEPLKNISANIKTWEGVLENHKSNN